MLKESNLQLVKYPEKPYCLKTNVTGKAALRALRFHTQFLSGLSFNCNTSEVVEYRMTNCIRLSI